MKNRFKNKNVLILGLGKSGESSLSLLTKMGAFCYLYDENKNVLKQFAGLDICNVATEVDEDLIKVMDFVIISPGVSIFSEEIKLAKLFGVEVISELELGISQAKGKIIGITGTNGKTTTSSLVYHILKLAQKSAVLCGNIGEPITENLLPFKSNYVVEMSSFQLESAKNIKTDISAITNITPNHLDRHLNFSNYRDAKYQIFKNMTRHGLLVLNFDDRTLQKLKEQKIKPKIDWISTKSEIEGYFVREEKIFFKKKSKTTQILDISKTKLLGEHNLSNILIAVAICKKLKIKNEIIQEGINSFEPLPHRLQFIKNVNGIDYINDSKSTSPDSTITAISAFKNKPLVLLLGGSDKKASFNRLAQKIKKSTNIKLVVVSGHTSKKIISALRAYGVKNFQSAQDFLSGLELATKFAENGDTILLSPACASFDYFKSFEERGETFTNYVNSLNKN